MSKCKAKVATGPRKGQRCKLTSKYAGYCGVHKSLLVTVARRATKTQRLALISGIGVSLITMMEKAVVYLPDAIEVISHFMKLPKAMYPVRDPQRYNELMQQHAVMRQITRNAVLRDARKAVDGGNTSSKALTHLERLSEEANYQWKAKDEFSQLFELLRNIENLNDDRSS